MRHEVALEFSYSNAFPVAILVAMRPGVDIRDVCVSVRNAFNAAARLSIGTQADPELIVKESDVRLSVAGDYCVPLTWAAPDGVPDAERPTIYLFVNSGAATSGIFCVYFTTGDLGRVAS